MKQGLNRKSRKLGKFGFETPTFLISPLFLFTVSLGAPCAACGSASTSTVVEVPPPQDLPQAPPPATVQVVTAPSLMRAGEEWVGRYVCAQGETDLDLHIDRVMGDSIEATFEFSHGPSNAGGAYKMRGTIAPNGQVTLTPGAWIDRPSGYISVGMHGDVQGARFAGRMDHASCTTFDLRRR